MAKLVTPNAPNTLAVTASPHIMDSALSVQRVMFDVLIALVPTTLVTVYVFGFRPLVVIAVSVIAAMVSEAVCQRLMRVPTRIWDGSAAITAVLLAMNVAPAVPLWLVAVGAVIAIVFAKMLFGGLGYNIFNPALIGRAVLLGAWPVAMTKGWVEPFWWREADWGFFSMRLADTSGVALDGISAATVLETGKDGLSYLHMFLGAQGGCIGETSAVAIILGGLYLWYRGHIYWQNPATYIATTALLSWVFGGSQGYTGLFQGDWLTEVLSGGLLLCAFFMSTDMVTCPMTVKGQVWFGIGCGFFTWVIRWTGGPPEGASYAVLLMNAATPLIDRYTVPRIFGQNVEART